MDPYGAGLMVEFSNVSVCYPRVVIVKFTNAAHERVAKAIVQTPLKAFSCHGQRCGHQNTSISHSMKRFIE